MVTQPNRYEMYDKACPKTNARILQSVFVLLIPAIIFGTLTSSLVACSDTSNSQNGALAYSWYKNGKTAIYLITLGESHPRQITDGKAHDLDPAWSPDGSHIAFVSDRDSPSITAPRLNVYIIGEDGNGLRQITNNEFDNFSPSWSPDSKKLAFASCRNGTTRIYLVDVQTGAEYVLTTGDSDSTQPAWSPDGKYIAFASNRSGEYEIYIMRPDGTGVFQLTSTSHSYNPAWSADSKSVVFEEGDAISGTKISIIQLDTRIRRNVTSEGIFGQHPSWATNANLIAFSSIEDDITNVFVFDMENAELQRVTSDGGFDPAWKPE